MVKNSIGRQLEGRPSDRRRFLTILGSTTVVGSVGGVLEPRLAYAVTLTKAQRDELTPDEIIALMKQGNERFRKGGIPLKSSTSIFAAILRRVRFVRRVPTNSAKSSVALGVRDSFVA